MTDEEDYEDLHLVVFSEQFYPDTSGGAHTRWLFAQRAVEKGAEITVFTMRDRGTPRSERVNGVDIKRPVPGSPSFVPVYNNFSLPFRLLSSLFILIYCLLWFNRRSPDAIHSTSYSFHWVGKLLAIIYGLPLTNFMGYTPSIRNNNGITLRRVLEHVNFKLFMGSTVFCRTPRVRDTIKSVGHEDVRILHGILNQQKIKYIAESDAKTIRRFYDIFEENVLIVFVGRLVPIKRPLTAFNVVQELPAKYKLLMIGDGPERSRLEEQIKVNNLSSRVSLIGELSHEETLKLIKASDVLILTSEAEAYPTVVFEALAMGSTVVATPVGILNTIEHNKLHVCNLECQTSILKEMDEFSTELQPDVLQDYSIERYTYEILQCTEQILNDHGKRAKLFNSFR